MALESNNQNDQTSYSPSASKSAGKKGGGFMNLTSRLAAPVSRSSSGEALNTISKYFKDKLAEEQVDAGLHIVSIDPSTSNLVAPAIAVVQVKDNVAAIFTILVAHGVGKLQPRTFKFQDREDAVMPTTMGDIYNSTNSFYDKVEDIVSKSVKATEFYEAGVSVIPTELELTDEEALRRILHRASCATHTLLHPEETTVSLAALEDEELVAHLDFSQGQTYTGAGLPVRKSFAINLYTKARGSNNHDDLAVQTRSDVTQCVGYVDLNHVGKIPVPGVNGTQVMSSQSLVPHIHLTSTEVDSGITTPELQLLSLGSAGLLLRDYTYEQALRQKFNGDQVDFHSLNGLRLEIGGEVGAEQSDFDLRAFMAEFTHNAPIFTLDVPECDDLSWCWSDLRLAAQGDKPAYNRVIKAANELTDGYFGQYFQEGNPIAAAIEDRVILGYFKDAAGNLVDLRQLDYLAALNLLGETDKNAAFAYGDTFNVNKGPLEQRISDRLSIQQNMTGGSAVVTGYATPIALMGDFLVALFNGIDACARGIFVDNPTNTTRTISRDQHDMLRFSANPAAINRQQFGTGGTSSRYSPNVRSLHKR